ncbi:MAG: hypothetical protein ACI4VL_00935, partial [Bacilli bacterium]
MRKKLKNISILSITALVILTLALPVKAEEKICKQHKDYYLFSYLLRDITDKKNNAETTPTLQKVFSTDYPKDVLSNVPTTSEKGRVAITKGSINDKDGKEIAIMDLTTYYDIYSKIKDSGKKIDFTNHNGENGENDAYYKLTETNDDETITYYYHGKWFEENDSGDPIEFKDMIKDNTAYKGSFLPEVKIEYKEVENKNLIQFTVTRNIDIKKDLADEFTSFNLSDTEKDVGLAPTVYLIEYEDENDCITTYNATINYLDKETKKEVHD